MSLTEIAPTHERIVDGVFLAPDEVSLAREGILRAQLEGNVMDSMDMQRVIASIGEYQPGIEYASFAELEDDYDKRRQQEIEPRQSGRLRFMRDGEEIRDMTHYNMAVPIRDPFYDTRSGKEYFIMMIRSELPEDERNSRLPYFRADSPFSNDWEYIDDETIPAIEGQDPYHTRIGDELITTIVKTEPIPGSNEPQPPLRWKTVFYRGTSISNSEPFAESHWNNKDIRPAELQNKKVLVITRPQNIESEELGGRGQIAVLIGDSIDIVKDPDVLASAQIINTRFKSDEWGGVNQIIILKDPNKVGLVGHIARYKTEDPRYAEQTDKPKKYATWVGELNLTTFKIEDMRLTSRAEDFPSVSSKTELLEDVDYCTGMTEPNQNGIVREFHNKGDAAQLYSDGKDPFEGKRLLSNSQSLAA